MADEPLRQNISFGTEGVDDAERKLDRVGQKADRVSAETRQKVLDSVRQVDQSTDAMLQKLKGLTGSKTFSGKMSPEQAESTAPYIQDIYKTMRTQVVQERAAIRKAEAAGAPTDEIGRLQDHFRDLVGETLKVRTRMYELQKTIDPTGIEKNIKGFNTAIEGGTRNFTGAISTGAIGLTNILEGLQRGSISQVAGGITGMAQAAQLASEGKLIGGLGQIGKFLMSPAGLGTMAAAAPLALLGMGAADVMGNWKEAAQNQLSIVRAENLMGGLGTPGAALGSQWATQQAIKWGMAPGEVAGTLGTFMQAGGRAEQARGVTGEALAMGFVTGTDSKVFAKAVGDMERWVPKGDFSKAISQGYIDAQRYGVKGLAASGELYQAQSQIAQMLSRTGGYFIGGTGVASQRIGETMMKYGFAGEPGAQIAGQMIQSLPGMLMDPLKASQGYNVLGLSMMQMLRPGKPGASGLTGPEQMLNRMQSPEFKSMVGGQAGAGLWAMGMGLNPELVMRIVGGEKVSAKEIKDKLDPQAAAMKTQQNIANLLQANNIHIQSLARADQMAQMVASTLKVEEYTKQMAGGTLGKVGDVFTQGFKAFKDTGDAIDAQNNVYLTEAKRLASEAGTSGKKHDIKSTGSGMNVHIYLDGKDITRNWKQTIDATYKQEYGSH